jgi:hypothetical protein
MGAFDEVYTKPRRCGHETIICLRNKYMKDSVNIGNTLIDGYSSSFIFC